VKWSRSFGLPRVGEKSRYSRRSAHCSAISHDQIIYMGDGSSDLPVMMHVNHHDGLTIAVSEAMYITKVARRTVLSDNAMSVLVPVFEEVLRWDSARIRRMFC